MDYEKTCAITDKEKHEISLQENRANTTVEEFVLHKHEV